MTRTLGLIVCSSPVDSETSNDGYHLGRSRWRPDDLSTRPSVSAGVNFVNARGRLSVPGNLTLGKPQLFGNDTTAISHRDALHLVSPEVTSPDVI